MTENFLSIYIHNFAKILFLRLIVIHFASFMIAVFYAELIHLFSAILGVFVWLQLQLAAKQGSSLSDSNCMQLKSKFATKNILMRELQWENAIFVKRLSSTVCLCVKMILVSKTLFALVVATFFDLVAWKSSNVKPFHAFFFVDSDN